MLMAAENIKINDNFNCHEQIKHFVIHYLETFNKYDQIKI